MAQFRAEFEDASPIVNVYEFDDSLFEIFRFKRFEKYSKEWAHFVYDHRTEPEGRTLHDYDIVYECFSLLLWDSFAPLAALAYWSIRLAYPHKD